MAMRRKSCSGSRPAPAPADAAPPPPPPEREVTPELEDNSIIKVTWPVLVALVALFNSHSIAVLHSGQLNSWDWQSHLRMHAACHTEQQPWVEQGSEVRLSPAS
mmetsp:Transcript_7924/g.21975  ORF Transcript_7924/g.21975 Transcript_7924/m.21975 type:complete len:104 (-) Transcript_7924:408-719(-)